MFCVYSRLNAWGRLDRRCIRSRYDDLHLGNRKGLISCVRTNPKKSSNRQPRERECHWCAAAWKHRIAEFTVPYRSSHMIERHIMSALSKCPEQRLVGNQIEPACQP